MTRHLGEFVFSVDTVEVAVAEPAPMAGPSLVRRRGAETTAVVLRLPALSKADMASAAMYAVIREQPPTDTSPASPSNTVETLAAKMVLPTVAPAAEAPGSTPSPVAPTMESPISPVEDQDRFWTQPRFLLAGVAALFLAFVSLLAVNRKPGDQPAGAADSGTTESALADAAADSPTPVVVRLGDSTPPPREFPKNSPALPDTHFHPAAPVANSPWPPASVEASTGDLAPRGQSARFSTQATANMPTTTVDATQSEGTARILPNLNLIDPTMEASHDDPRSGVH